MSWLFKSAIMLFGMFERCEIVNCTHIHSSVSVWVDKRGKIPTKYNGCVCEFHKLNACICRWLLNTSRNTHRTCLKLG